MRRNIPSFDSQTQQNSQKESQDESQSQKLIPKFSDSPVFTFPPKVLQVFHEEEDVKDPVIVLPNPIRMQEGETMLPVAIPF